MLVSAAIPCTLWVFRRVLRGVTQGEAASPLDRNAEQIVDRVKSRYLSQAICVTGLSLLVLVFFPVILAIGQVSAPSAATFFASLVIFFGAFFLGILVLFLKRKGNLDWETDEDIADHEL